MENNVNWSQEQMFEVFLKEPDDFLKSERHYLVLVLLLEKKRNYTNLAIYFINKVSIILYTSKNYLHLMVRTQIYLKMILLEEIQ